MEVGRIRERMRQKMMMDEGCNGGREGKLSLGGRGRNEEWRNKGEERIRDSREG